MESFDWSLEQQEDMRNILKPVRDHFRSLGEKFQGTEVVVTPQMAFLTVPIARTRPAYKNPTVEESEKLQEYSLHIDSLIKPLRQFLFENTIGSPLYGHFENTDVHIVIRYGLKPNDVLGAERNAAKALKAIQSYEENKPKT